MAGPWEKYGGAAAAPVGGDPIVKPAPKVKPADLPGGWEYGPDGTARPISGLPPKAVAGMAPEAPRTSYRTMSAQEVASAGLPAGTVAQVSSEGNISVVSKGGEGGDTKATEYQSKSAGFYGRMKRAERSYATVPADSKDPRNPVGQFVHEWAPNIENSLPVWLGGNSSDRQRSDQNVRDFIAATLRQESGAAIGNEEFQRQYQIFFPMPGDAPDVIAQKAEARRQAIEGFRIAAGPLAGQVDATFGPEPANEATADPNASGGTEEDEGITGTVSDETPSPFDPKPGPTPEQIVDKYYGDPGGMSGVAGLAKHGITLGLSDEAAGLGGFISDLFRGQNPIEGYRRERDAEQLFVDRARQELGLVGTAAEFMGGLSLPGKALNALPTVGNAAKTGAIAGGTAGFGYGEGAQGSVTNALLGGTIGGVIGAGSQVVAPYAAQGLNALTQRATNRKVPPDIGARAQEVAAAGQAEGVNVNRAMVDPRLQNRVTAVDASMIGGPRVQRGMNAVEGQIEGRVQGLGQGGTPLNKIEEGEVYRRAGERAIAQTGKAARAKYNRAEQLAGGAKVTPAQSAKALDDMITDLSELEGMSGAELAYLRGLRGDLDKDLSVAGLRRMRTNLRKKISKGDLVFGEDEARVLSVMDTAADDIRAGLQAQGKTAAANAFDAADKAYRARMEYITGTVQQVIGKRGANLAPEAIADRIISKANGKDAGGLRKFYASLTPEERADVAATFAERIGKNAKDGFSVAHFLRQTSPDRLSPHALRTLFGPEGAQSVQNLRTLAEETNRVTSAMNSRTSKSAVPGDYRTWLFNLLLGGGGAIMESGKVMALAAGAGAAKAGRDILNARSLMSPDVTKWLRQAPRTTNPAVINAHLAKIPGVMDAKAVQDYLRQTVAASPGRVAASTEEEQDGRRPPPQQQRP